GKCGDPQQIHHADSEKQQHHHPAAAETEGPVHRAHPQRTHQARPPVLCNEGEGAAAVREASVLERRKFIGGSEQKRSADVSDEDSSAMCVSKTCTAAAAMAKPPQTSRYPAPKTPLIKTGRLPCFRWTAVYSKIIGAAPGSIMPTIITAHIVATSTNCST